MKKLFYFFILFFLIFSSKALAYSSDPKEFITELVGEAIEKLSDKSMPSEDKAKFIEKLL